MAETLIDDLSPLYRQTRDAMDGDRWQQTLAVGRRPQQVQSPADVKTLVADIAPRYGVDPRLVESVIGLESGGQPGAVSRKGAQGLMQLMPGTARRFGVVDPLDPVQNITGGVKYLAWLRDQFPGRTDLQLAGYHAGEGAVRNAGYAIPNTNDGNMSTQQYVTTILARYQPTLPGEGQRPGLDVRGDLARQALREGQAGPTLQVNTDVNQLSAQARAGRPQQPLPGEGGMPPLDVSRETQARPLALPGTPLRVETDLGNLMARTEGQPTALPAGSRPFDAAHPALEPGLVEDRAGRIVGGIATGAVGMVENMLQSVVAGENLVGLKRPDVPGMTDPMGVEFLLPPIQGLEKVVAPRLGGQSPDFVDKLANGIGTSLASLLPGAAAQRFLQGVSTVAPGVARLGGAATSGMIEAAGEAGDVYQQMAPMVGEEEASKRALKSFAANTILVTATDKFGIFGEEARLLRRTLAGAIANGVQEAVQYDIERRQLWVPANNPAAEALKAAGWVPDGDRLVKPFAVKDAAEAALIGMVIGGPAAAAVGMAVEQSPQVQHVIEQERQEVAQQMPETTVTHADGMPLRVYSGGMLSNQSGAVGGRRRRPAPSSQSVAADDMPGALVTGEGGQPLRMYHGTAQAFEQFALDAADPNALYGPGFYFTDNPRVAGGTGELRPAQQQKLDAAIQERATVEQTIARMEAAHDPNADIMRRELTLIDQEIAALEGQGSERELGYASPGFRQDLGPNVRPAYLDIRNPFDIDQPIGRRVADRIRRLDPERLTGVVKPSMTGDKLFTDAPLSSPSANKAALSEALQALGYDGITHIGGGNTGTAAHRVYIAFHPEQVIPAFSIDAAIQAIQRPDTPPPGIEPSVWQRWGSALTSLLPDIQPGMIGGILRSQRGSISGAPTLRLGAEGLTPERYRTASGGWRVPLKDIPSAELELKDFVVQQGGIQLAGEELRGELEAVISRKETGLSGLQNNSSGLTLQQMAESAEQQGFIPTADKEALLQALDRSVVQGHPVWSLNATGRINLLDDPFVSAAYQAVVDAVETMQERTVEQVAGVRHRREVHAEAAADIQMGMFTHDDIREILPNTTLNDTQASALVQSLNTIGEELGEAAQRFLDGGARVGSREEASLQEIMALLAELDPVRLGVSAAQARGLGILNDPLSGYTQYLNNLHRALETAPEKTMAQIAKNILAAKPQKALTREELAAHPELLEDLFQRHYEMVERFKANPLQFQLESEDAGTLLAQRTPEERALIEAAYTPGGEPRTVEEWNALSQAAKTAREQEAIARAREQWQQGTLDYQAFQAELKEGYQGRQLDLPDSQGATFHAATQLNLFDEFKEVQEALTALREDRASDAQKELLDAALRPWKATQEQLSLPLMKGLMDSTRPGFAEYFKELMYNAWLSNPSTHLANFISNLGVTAWAIPERWVAQNYQAGTEGIPRGEANAMLYGLVHGLQDAWTLAYRSWQAGRPLSGLGREWTKDPAGNAQDMGFDPASPWGKMIDFFFNYIGLASGGRLPSRALMASDEFFKMLNYRAELNALAYRDAVRHGYEGRAFAEHVTRVVTTPQLAQLQEAAKTFSVIQTFQNELQPGGLGERIQGLAEYSVNILGTDQTFPVGRVILPFIQTPSNIARYALERTPLGLFFSTVQADLRAGGERAALAHAKVSMGTIAMTALAGLALSGKLTGRGPEDRELRDIWRQSYQPYSVKLPTGQWVSLDRFEPLGLMVKMVADLVQVAGEAHTDTWQMATLAPIMAFLKGVSSASYFQALSSFFDIMAPDLGATDQTWGAKLSRWSNRTIAGLVMPSSGLAATARFLDPVERDAQSLVDALYSRIPGWKDDIPARRTLGGDKLLFGWGFQPEVLANTIRAYAPLKLGTGRIALVDHEILRNKMQLDLPPRSIAHDAVPVGQLAGETQMDTGQLQPLRLTPEQYEKYVVLASGNQAEAQKLKVDLPGELLGMLVDGLSQEYNAVPPASVKSLYDFLDWAVQQPHYQAQSPGAGGGKEALFKRAINAYRGVGKQLLLAQDDALRTQRDESMIQATVQSLPLNIQRETAQQMRTQYGAAATQTKEQLGLHVGGARP